VDQHVDPAELLRGGIRELVDRVEIGEIDGPGPALRRRLPAVGEHGVEQLGAARAHPDDRAGRGELAGQRGTDARRRAGEQDPAAGPVEVAHRGLTRAGRRRP
jgi:hypothetical protein